MVLEPMAKALEVTVNSIGGDVLVFRDPNCRPRVSVDRVAYMARLERMSRRAGVVKVGMDNLDFITPDNHSIGVRRLLDGRANVMLHTDGSRIVHVHSAAGEFEVPVRRVQVADTIGAGDALGGGFAAWWDQSGLTVTTSTIRLHCGPRSLSRSPRSAARGSAPDRCNVAY
jgi:fructokinase